MASQLRWTSKSVDLLCAELWSGENWEMDATGWGRGCALLCGEEQDLECGRDHGALREGGVYLGHGGMSGGLHRKPVAEVVVVVVVEETWVSHPPFGGQWSLVVEGFQWAQIIPVLLHAHDWSLSHRTQAHKPRFPAEAREEKGATTPCLCELRIGDGPGAGCRGKVSSRFGVPPFSSRRLFPSAASHLALPELRLSPATSFLALHRGHESDVIAEVQTDHRRFFFFYSFLILGLVGFSLVSALSRPLHPPCHRRQTVHCARTLPLAPAKCPQPQSPRA